MLCKARYLQQGGFLRKVSFLPWHGLSYSTYSDRGKNHKATPLQERRMIDRFWLNVKGGEGGSGNASVRRNRTNRFGKPDGGNGGKGGDVILKCTSAVWDFRGLQHHINGKRGGNGSSKNQIGSPGEDKVVQVPVGTVIHLVEGNIPSSVEMPSAGTHPWDTPGTLTPDILVSDEESFSINKPPMEKGEDCVNISSSGTAKHISSLNPCAQGSSIRSNSLPFSSCGNSTLCEKALVSNHDGEKSYKSMPAADACNLENDGGFSEETSEEEEDVIQYNFAELTEDGQQIIIACGGEGGLGSVSSNRRPKKASKYIKHDFGGNDNIDGCGEEDQPSLRAGLPGSQASVILELKSIADVGLVGMPNAGKSTLLGVISKAKPTVGDYSFTTLRPNLGKLNYDEVSITVADIPGLISGAHENRGLGHDFLRHIERTKLLVYVVDLAAALDDRKGIPPWEQLRDLVVELECYREGLSDRPSLVVANKTDENGAGGVLEELQKRVQGIPIYPVCAILEEGIPELKAALRELVNGGELARLRLENILID
ncbi:putative GTP-binding protein OBGM, mitochondrial [Silene latifolia]|uniref:putative GTP-binding protein OBGM, mitochondrial n=1 Tax=Silene latifolia TaxID=37657 RepID=UPI003D787C04